MKTENLETRLKEIEQISFEDWIKTRQLRLEEFLTVLKNDNTDVNLLKKVILEFSVHFSYLISEKAIFKKKLSEAKELYEMKSAEYIDEALSNGNIKEKDAKYKQQNYIIANTDINMYKEMVLKYQNVVDYLEDAITMFRKIPISEFMSLIQLELKL